MMTITDDKRTYGVAVHLHFTVEADTVEEAFERVIRNCADAIHYTGDSRHAASVLISGTEDEIEASLEAEWKNGVLNKIGTEREVF